MKTKEKLWDLPVVMGIFEKILPNNQSLTGDQALDVIGYCFFVSIGLSMLFNRNASSGGLDIIAKFLNKYLHMEFGKAMGGVNEMMYSPRC